MAPKKNQVGASPAAVKAFAASNPTSRTAAAVAAPQPKTVSQALRIAGQDGISKQELTQISKQFDTPANKIIQSIDQLNKNLKAKDQPGIAVNSGAVNMLIKQAENQPATGFDAYLNMISGKPQYGTGQIGKAIQSMIGSPGFAGTPIKGQLTGAQPAVPSQMMIGGTMIRPGGRVAVRPMGAAPAIAETVAPTDTTGGGGETTGGDMTGGEQFDYQSILDALAGLEQPEFDMSALTDMFNTQFEQLKSQFQTNKPLQLAQLGRAYGGDAIRARQRMRKTTRDYRRSLPSAALGQAMANLAIGGGLTL